MPPIILFIFWFFYTLLFFFRAQNGAIADEVDFLKPIAAWVDSGPSTIGLWHTPFYPWLLSFIGKLFWLNPFSARVVGYLCWTINASLLIKIARLSFSKLEPKREALLFFTALFSPVAFGSALLIDYDTTLLVPLTTFYFYRLLYYWTGSKSIRIYPHALELGALVGLCLCAKETTPLAYPVGIFTLAFLKKKKLGQAVLVTTSASLVSGVVFLGLSFLWCQYYGISLSQIFEMAKLGLKTHGATSLLETRGLGTWIWVKTFPIFWVGIPWIWLLFFHRKTFTDIFKKFLPVVSVLVVVILTYTFLINQMTYQFPKYMVPFLIWIPFLAIFAVSDVQLGWKKTDLIFLLLAFTGPSPFKILTTRDFPGMLELVLFLGFGIGILYFLRRKTVLPLALAFQAAFLSLVVFHPDQSINYWPGESALSELAQSMTDLKVQLPKTLFSPAKDLAYLSNENGILYYPKDKLAFVTKELCEQKEPFGVITRIREDSSLARAAELGHLKGCLPHLIQTKSLLIGWTQ